MKLRIVKEEYCATEGGLIPTKMIHEFEGQDCCLITKFYGETGDTIIGIRNKPGDEPFRTWKLKYEKTKDAPFPDQSGELEQILIYVVEDIEKS